MNWKIFKMEEEFGPADLNFLDRIMKEAAPSSPPFIVLDLSRTVYINSAVLGRILYQSHKYISAGGKLALLRPSGNVMTLLELTSLTQVLTVVTRFNELEDLSNSEYGGPTAAAEICRSA